MNNANDITGEIIGIVCPIYFLNMPHIVRDFIKKIKKAKYLFMVYAGTGDLGTGLKATKKLFAAQNMKLSAVFNIPLPDNSTVHAEPEEKEQETEDKGRILRERKGKAESPPTKSWREGKKS